MKKPVLIVIAGPNGSGKTSITHKILQHDWIEDCIAEGKSLIFETVFSASDKIDFVKKAKAAIFNGLNPFLILLKNKPFFGTKSLLTHAVQ